MYIYIWNMKWFTLNIRIKLSKFHIQYMIRMAIYVNTCVHIIHILHTYSIHHLVYHLKQLGYTGLYPGKNHIQTRMHMDFPTGYVSKPWYPDESIPWFKLNSQNLIVIDRSCHVPTFHSHLLVEYHSNIFNIHWCCSNPAFRLVESQPW